MTHHDGRHWRRAMRAAGLVCGFILLARPLGVQATGPLLRTVAVGQAPRAVAVDARTGRVFVANYNGNSVTMLDARTGLFIRTIRLFTSSHPRRIVIDQRLGHVFVESVGDTDNTGALIGPGAVTMLDAATGVILAGAVTGKGPLAIAVDNLTARVFIANYDDDTVTVIDARSGHALATMNAGSSPIAFAVDALRGHVFVANKYGNTVSVLNATTGFLLRKFAVCATPHELAIDATRARLAVACWGRVDGNDIPLGKGSLDILNARTGAVVRKVRVGIYPWAVASNRQSGHIFVANWGKLDKSGSPINPGTINTIDTLTGRIVHSTTIGYGPGPLAVDLGRGRVYVANSYTVGVIDATTGLRRQVVTVGNDVEDLTIDSATNRLFAVNGSDNTVSVIDTAAL